MKNVKTMFTVLILAFLAFSCSTEEDEEIIPETITENLTEPNGEINFRIGEQTAAYNDARIFFNNPTVGWTTVHAVLYGDDGVVIDWIQFAFEGDTPGEYAAETYEDNLIGNYSSGPWFPHIRSVSSGLAWVFDYRDIKTESLLVLDIGENEGDQIAGTFSGLVEIDGVDVEFTGDFDFLR